MVSENENENENENEFNENENEFNENDSMGCLLRSYCAIHYLILF